MNKRVLCDTSVLIDYIRMLQRRDGLFQTILAHDIQPVIALVTYVQQAGNIRARYN